MMRETVFLSPAAFASQPVGQRLLPAYQRQLRLPPPDMASRATPDLTGALNNSSTEVQAVASPVGTRPFPDRRTDEAKQIRSKRTIPSETVTHAVRNNLSRRIALALQGGGAHGAFTWGVLDRLLDERGLEITALSGSSAGALNAVALAVGLVEGGREGAKFRLDQLWRRIASLADLSGISGTSLERLMPSLGVDWSLGHQLFDIFTRYVSPYQFNPFGIDPLRQMLVDLFDMDLLRRDEALPLFIGATRVDTGEIRLFENSDLTIDAILASSCLPAINQAIKIDDTYYWDGGFSANPPLLPLVTHSLSSRFASDEILLVRVDPVHESHVPITAGGIRGRLNRFMFNAPLNAELRTLSWLQNQLSQPPFSHGAFGQHLSAMKVHTLSADDAMRDFSSSSKLRPDLHMIERLHQLGREAADKWLEESVLHKRETKEGLLHQA